MSRPPTPLMEQYREIKSRHQDAILFFRMGDFYEMFYDDAVVASRTLGLTLTARNNGGAAEVPLAGVPVKAASDYLRRLVEHGFRVSICEQVEDPRLAKGLVRREVVETVTPGAAFADDLLDASRHNYLCALAPVGDESATVAAVDVSTGDFRIAFTPSAAIGDMLARFSPREILVARGAAGGPLLESALRASGALVTEREGWEFDSAAARDDLAKHFGVHSLDGFGVTSDDGPALGAAGALLRYLRELQPGGLPHLAPPRVERAGGTMVLDEMTRRNLELVESMRGERAGSLLDVLDNTLTPMGARLLHEWILAPLSDRDGAEERLGAVAAFVGEPVGRELAREALDGVRDIERLTAKTAALRASPREVCALARSLERLPALSRAVARVVESAGESGCGRLGPLSSEWDDCAEIAADIAATLVRDGPAAIGDEPTIAPAMDAELDELRGLRDGGKDGIARIQAEERARTGIQSLKVGYNRVFGYFIEVTNAHAHHVPDDYQRRQTLTGAERYVTPALKEFEARVLGATERIESRERELFDALRKLVASHVRRIQITARRVAELDVLAALAVAAERGGYSRPELTGGFDLRISGGRHPVVERLMAREKFIPNDVTLDENARVIVVTGPNMAGKSTILRQVGLIVVMAQVGSFVPARSARIGVVDRVFTRVGASDNLMRGQSTFMVEMAETSAILHSASDRSLVLLDEIGRGTSTYDGVSIAWAITEHLHDVIGCKTMFATHYHELTELADRLSSVRNFNVAVREIGDEILFLHRLEPGGADRSYGIEVGRLAGLPRGLIERAAAILQRLESGHSLAGAGEAQPAPPSAARARVGAREQLGLFTGDVHPAVERLKGVDVNSLTPLAALELLSHLVEDARAP